MKPAILRCSLALAALVLFGLIVVPVRAAISSPTTSPVFINTWLVLGTFSNTGTYYDAGLEHPWINETGVAPQAGASAAGHTWRYFDDRLFSRNYDNYQDLFSYFHIERHESVAGVVAYAHVYLYTPRPQAAQLCLAADWSAKAWLNGHMITRFIDGSGNRQTNTTDIQLQKGWNSLLLKIANTEDGRFGFYARICDRQGGNLPDLTVSPNGPGHGALQVTTQAMADLNLQPLGLTKSPTMPIGWRGWSYVGAHVDTSNPAFKTGLLRFFLKGGNKKKINRNDILQASNFQFTAQGGTPPYTWMLGDGRFPPGLTLHSDGTITGTILPEAKLGDYRFKVWVMDAQGKLASKAFSITVRPRPNKWYEETRFVGILEATQALTPAQIPSYVKILKREGYQVVMPNAFNNGGLRFHYPSQFSKIPVRRDWIALWKAAIEKEGMKFGVYVGNMTNITNPRMPFSNNQAILVAQEIIQRFHPTVLWLDWQGLDAISPDAIFSALRTADPKLVIVTNGRMRGTNGDWDDLNCEGAWGGWGKAAWGAWPVPIPWPLKNTTESWRLMVQPDWSPNPSNILSSWRQMLRIQIALIGEGFIADIDACPVLTDTNIFRPMPMNRMPLVGNRQKMADWSSPPGIPPLYPSYTWVNPGPLHQAFWGYNTINLKRDTIYLHILKNPRGKSGLPDDPTLTVRSIAAKVKDVIWMNANRPLQFTQRLTHTDHSLTINILGVKQDLIDTIIRIDLEHPLPVSSLPSTLAHRPIPPGNLAYLKPAWLLSANGSHELPPCSYSDFASNGVDGDLTTVAQASNEWAWTYQVDLQRICQIGRVVVIFPPDSYATEYNILLSVNGQQWRRVAHVTTNHGGVHESRISPALGRYVRIQAVKPDGPHQPGIQMGISELQIFAVDQRP